MPICIPAKARNYPKWGRNLATIKESIQKKSEALNRWRASNPGIEWADTQYVPDEPKIYLHKHMISSKAYRSLSRVAMLVYQDFLGKRMMKSARRDGHKVWVCENNGEIVYPYAEAESNGISRRDFRNAIDELQAKGFIDITHIGRGGRKPSTGGGDYTTYWLDDRWEGYGTEDFKPPRNPRRKDERRDRGWALYWNNKRKCHI